MSRHNNFDLLRLLAAIDVVALHVVDLTRAPQLAFLGEVDTKLALSVFFVISGFLIVQSYERSPSLADYTAKRARRILPAYVAVVLGAVALGAWLTTLPLAEYFGATTLKYLVANLSFLNFIQPWLPGVFANNPIPAVNGALWTIKVEVMFYASVPILVWLVRRIGLWPVMIAGYLFACGWWWYFTGLAASTGRGAYFELAKQLPGQLMYFLPGALLYYRLDWVLRHGPAFGLVCGWGLFAAVALEWTYLFPLALAGSVIFVALVVPHLGNATRFGDLSYGVYVLHFPIIQTLLQLGLFEQPWVGLTWLAALLLPAALASWHLVEKRFLQRRPARAAVMPAAA